MATMLACGDCGAVFEQPQHITETHGLDSQPYEELDVCPACYGVCLKETFPCDGCGEYIAGDYMETRAGDRFCESCYTRCGLFD